MSPPQGDPRPATVRALLREAAERLGAAGVASPAFDAAELLALATGRSRSTLPAEVPAEVVERYDALLARRAAREPLQHLTGSAGFRYLDLAVGPGVFVPRPETELLAGWAVSAAAGLEHPVVVDLCTGSGAVALSVATEVPHAEVHAVELDPGALAWAERNVAAVRESTGREVRLHAGDLADALPVLDATVDVVTCNPPYIPLEAWESVAPEVRDHDPSAALWSGEDGLDAMRVLERTAARLLRPGGVVGAEHADAQGASAPACFGRTGRWGEVRDHEDLAGRPRYLTARRLPGSGPRLAP